MSGGRRKGERFPTALPADLADEAHRQAHYWTALGTIGRALNQLDAKTQRHLLKALLAAIEKPSKPPRKP